MSAAALFVGIDVAMAKGKRMPMAFMRGGEGSPRPLAVRTLEITRSLAPPRGMGNAALVADPASADLLADAVAFHIEQVANALEAQVQGIAIDAPADFRPEHRPLRRAEAALGEARLSYFRTPSRTEFDHHLRAARKHLRGGGSGSTLPYANLFWMLVGFALFRRLSLRFPGADVLEVYPQATFSALDAAANHKSSAIGFQAQLAALARAARVDSGELTRDLHRYGYGKPHDVLDALSAAWVASLPPARRRVLGKDVRDGIWIPSTG